MSLNVCIDDTLLLEATVSCDVFHVSCFAMLCKYEAESFPLCLRAGARLSLHSDMSLPSKLRSLKLIAHCTTSIRRDVNSHFRSHENGSALGSSREEGGKPKVYLAGTGSALFEIARPFVSTRSTPPSGCSLVLSAPVLWVLCVRWLALLFSLSVSVVGWFGLLVRVPPCALLHPRARRQGTGKDLRKLLCAHSLD